MVIAHGVHGITLVGRFLIGLVAFVVVSALCGALIAGMTLPAIAAAGLGAKDASDHFLSLPTAFQLPVLPQRDTIEAADGSVIATAWTRTTRATGWSSRSPRSAS